MDNQEYLLTEKDKNLQAQVRKEFVKFFFYLLAVEDWNNASLILSNLKESRLGHVKMVKRRVAPATIIIGFRGIGRTEVGCCD